MHKCFQLLLLALSDHIFCYPASLWIDCLCGAGSKSGGLVQMQSVVYGECSDLGPCFWQSILWKRSGSSLNKEWKKKYVTLSNNGTLSYHSSSSVREHHKADQYNGEAQWKKNIS